MVEIFFLAAIFSNGKMVEFKKITEETLLSELRVGHDLLPPLVIRSLELPPGPRGGGAAIVETEWPSSAGTPAELHSFVVRAKAIATPKSVLTAMMEAKAAAEAKNAAQPMILVPYLSEERIAQLEKELVSGVDLCGNGIVIVPGKLLVLRTGKPNKHPSSQRLNNPYQGRSALVGRTMLFKRTFSSLNELAESVNKGGVTVSLSQVSKAVSAMTEDLVIGKSDGSINLNDPVGLLEKLGRGWRDTITGRRLLRVRKGSEWWRALSSMKDLKWAVTGESSASRYVNFAQGGPVRVAVENLSQAREAIGEAGSNETVPSFADLELCEVEDPGYFFAPETDERGIRWASKVQTWLELQSGGARQKDASNDVKSLILNES